MDLFEIWHFKLIVNIRRKNINPIIPVIERIANHDEPGSMRPVWKLTSSPRCKEIVEIPMPIMGLLLNSSMR